MLVDARTLPDGHEVHADLCIVGGGPAALALAHELRDTSLSICIVESGPQRPAPAFEALNETLVNDSDLAPLVNARARALGGTSHRWNLFSGGYRRGVRLLPFSALDHQERSWVPDSGWPFPIEELRPFERRARRIAGLPEAVIDATEAATDREPLLPLDPDRVRTAIEWIGDPHRFRTQLPRTLAHSVGVTILTHATVMSVTTRHTSTAVDGVTVRTAAGGTLSVTARRVVLATGGIENARLLLESTDTHPNGLGNQHHLVGRYYMDHIKLMPADVHPADPALFDRMTLYDIHQHEGALIAGRLQLTEAAQRDLQILNAAVRFEPRPSEEVVDTTLALWRLAAGLRRHARLDQQALRSLTRHRDAWPRLAALGAQLALKQRRPVPSLTHGWSRLDRPSRHFEKFVLELQIELAPRPENRITLSERRNVFGQRLPNVSWHWSDLEHRTVRETVRELDRIFRAASLGTVSLRPHDQIEVLTPAGDNHPTGTTRMHRDPAHGVVDEHGRVHGIENLYVTGSSVFPTSGYANPTLTILTMAVRLADHLARTG